jgi:hypothetical protein
VRCWPFGVMILPTWATKSAAVNIPDMTSDRSLVRG